MIKIKKGTDTKTVTKGAYQNFYESLGYEIVNSKLDKNIKEAKIVEPREEKREINKEDNRK